MDGKPISVQIEEAKRAIVNTVNGLKMNPYILEPIVKELHDALIEAKRAQYKTDMEQLKKGGTDGECSERAGED